MISTRPGPARSRTVPAVTTLLLVLAGLLLQPGAVASTGRFDLEALARLTKVSDPQISPDGRSIVVIVSRPNYDDNRTDSEMILVDIATGAQRVLTRGRKQLASPRWSPTGDRLAFLAEAAPLPAKKKAKPAGETAADVPAAAPAPADPDRKPARQVHVLPMNGGDALVVTDAPEGVQQFAWRPDGGAIAYVTQDPFADPEARKKGEDAFDVGDNDFLAQEPARPSHVWMIPGEGGEAKRLTSGTWSLPMTEPPGPPSSPIAWSPDGKTLAITKQEKPHFGDADLTTIQLLDVATGQMRPLTTQKILEGYPSFSPDGSQIALWYPRDGDQNQVNEILVVPSSGGTPRSLTRALDRCLYRALWMPDGKSILVGGNDGTRVSMWQQPLEGPARKLNLGKVNPSWSFWIDATVGKGGAIAFTGSEPQRPSELYYLASPAAEPKRLTAYNDEVASLDLGRVERFEWKGPEGQSEDGVVLLPPGFDATRKYPLVLYIHGGPQAASTEAFSAFPQILAGRGYVVFSPNYRGSDNNGNDYQKAIVGDAGDGPGRDVIAGLEALKARGFVDASRIGVSGWSYGGYMTSWLIGHYDIWKTAVAGAAVTDFTDQYNLADFNVQARYSFGGSPWTEGREKAYLEQSPITSASKIKTPTLILSDTGDIRVPVTQSYRLYHALKDNGVPTRFIAYPVPGHFPGDPVRARAVFRDWIAWLDASLQPEAAPAPKPQPGDGVVPVKETPPATSTKG
jgi:dipeptidyl aminopeptidase/acylaminoacyl peptidase